MRDSIDIYSKPIKTKRYKLGILYYMRPRRHPKKPGRELLVPYDDRFPFVKDFKVHYCYFVRFLKKGNTAGNHYHIKKHELFVPIIGKFTIKLEDINTKEQEKLTMHSKDYTAFYIPSRVSHAVTSEVKNGVLLVLATSAGSKEDEYPYEIKL